MRNSRQVVGVGFGSGSAVFVALLVAATTNMAARTQAETISTLAADNDETDTSTNSGKDTLKDGHLGRISAGGRQRGGRTQDPRNLNSSDTTVFPRARVDFWLLGLVVEDPAEYVARAVQKGFRAQNELCARYCNGTTLIERESYSCMLLRGLSCSPCYCDDKCKYYRDCCPQLDSVDPPNIMRADEHWCQKIMFGFDTRFEAVIATCANDKANETASSSERKTKKTPMLERNTGTSEGCPSCDQNAASLVLSLDTGAVYCSRQCGKCNGENRLVSILQTPCLDSQESVLVSNHRDDRYNLLAPHRRCMADVTKVHVDSCRGTMTSRRENGDVMESLCRQYSYPVLYGGVSYRNLFCALCNVRKVVPVHSSSCDRLSVSAKGFSVVTSLRPLYSYTYETVAPRQCEDHQWYDLVLDECRNVTCESGRTRTPELPYCEDHSVSNSSTWLYDISPAFTVITNASHAPCLNDWEPVESAIMAYLAESMQKLNVLDYAFKVSSFIPYDGAFRTYVQFMVSRPNNQTEFELHIIKTFTKQRISLKVVNDKTIEFRTHLRSYTYQIADFFWVSYANGSCCYKDGVNYESPLKNRTSGSDDLMPVMEMTLGPLTLFTQVALNASEYEIQPGGKVTLTYTNASLPSWQSLRDAGTLRVPAVYLEQAYRQAGLSLQPPRRVKVARRWSMPGEEILSLCCVIVSIASLVFLLATYSVFSQLRTLPGLNNMWLAGWLMLAQILLLAVPDRTDFSGCHVLGMLLHYAWLCVVGWSCVCSLHMFHVFVSQRDTLHAPHRQQWYLKRYLTLTHAVPALIVALVVACTELQTGGEDTGYGGHVCYLNSVLLRGLAFVLPLAAVVACNLVLLVLTARALAGAQRMHNFVARDSEPNNISIYARLSSLTGFCWMFTLMAEIPGCDWMRYVSAVLNGLQGLHLAVSYGANKRVGKLWRSKLRRRGKRGGDGVHYHHLGEDGWNSVCADLVFYCLKRKL